MHFVKIGIAILFVSSSALGVPFSDSKSQLNPSTVHGIPAVFSVSVADCGGCFVSSTYDSTNEILQNAEGARYGMHSKDYFFKNGTIVTADVSSPPGSDPQTKCKVDPIDKAKLGFADVFRLQDFQASAYTWLPRANITGFEYAPKDCALVTGLETGCGGACWRIPSYLELPCKADFCTVTRACLAERPRASSPLSLNWTSLVAVGFAEEDGRAAALTGMYTSTEPIEASPCA